MTDPDWYLGASCASTDPELFFPEKALGQYHGRIAKRICEGCPVIAECLQFALDSPNAEFGIWGGLTAIERRNLRTRTTTRRTA